MSKSTDAVQGMSDADIQLPSLEEGSLVKGKVIEVKNGQVLVDLNYKTEGIIDLDEFTSEVSGEKEEVKPGDYVEAVVVKKEDEEGRIILSKKRADFRRAWEQIRTAYYEGSPIEARVIQVVKGGLLLEGGTRLFLPASQVDLKKPVDLNEYLGKKIKAKVISIDERKKTAVVSRRALLEETGYSPKKEALSRLKVGQVVKGKVKSLVEYGAFVEVEGVTGLVHLSEIAWKRVTDPSQFLEIGQEVEVKVVQIDLERERLSLSMKRLQPNPWKELARKYRAGQRVKTRIVRFAPFGVFLELEDFEGLLHQSELREDLAVFKKNYSPGDEIEVGILSIDTFHQRISFTQFISPQPEVKEAAETKEKTEIEEEKLFDQKAEKEGEIIGKTSKKVPEKAGSKLKKSEPISTEEVLIEEIGEKLEEETAKEKELETVAEESKVKLDLTPSSSEGELNLEEKTEIKTETEDEIKVEAVSESGSEASTLEDILELMKKTHGSKKKDG